MNIGVVGAGFGGMASALFLARDGHRVTLYERAAKPGPVGAAIVLQPSGLAVLRLLGLDGRVEAASARIDRLHVTTPRGKTVVDLDYARLDPRWYGLGVGRGVLFDALFAAVRGSDVTLVTGTEVVALEPTAVGHVVVAASGARFGPHTLVVAADGARSRIAAQHARALGRRIVPYPWGALFFVGPQPDSAALMQIADGARRFMGVLPMGQGRASLFWSLRADRVAAWRARFDAWREEALALGPGARTLVDAIGGPDDVLFAPYFDVRMKRWHTRGLVAIGDAAHATSPQLGQGSNLALVDGFTLAESLRAPTLDASPSAAAARLALDDALAAYARRRKRHLAYYQRATRWLTPLFQGDSRALGWLRDVALPLACRVPPLKSLMVASMSGVAAGFFGRREPLVAPWP